MLAAIQLGSECNDNASDFWCEFFSSIYSWYVLICILVIFGLFPAFSSLTGRFMQGRHRSYFLILRNLHAGTSQYWKQSLQHIGATETGCCVVRDILQPVSTVAWVRFDGREPLMHTALQQVSLSCDNLDGGR